MQFMKDRSFGEFRNEGLLIWLCVLTGAALLLGCSSKPAMAQPDPDHATRRWVGPLDLEFVRVGDPGNMGDPYKNWGGNIWDPPFGDVDYVYWIGLHEVTVEAWCAFLNSVATEEDPYEFWIQLDGYEDNIERIDNGDGTYSYHVLDNRHKHPITRMDHRKIFRFCNWLHNGMQDDLSKTDYGSYDTSKWEWDRYKYLDPLDPEPDAKFWLTREDEWYKAAYYDPHRYRLQPTDDLSLGGWKPGYWRVPTRHNDLPDPYEYPDPDPNNCSVQCEFSSQPWGLCPLTQSPWGAYDMAGNAKEMMAAWMNEGWGDGTAYVVRGDE